MDGAAVNQEHLIHQAGFEEPVHGRWAAFDQPRWMSLSAS